MPLPTGITDGAKPAKALLKRIDIGLTTGIIAVFIAFLSLILAQSQTKMALEAQKASVLPIIDIDMGYGPRATSSGSVKQHFEVTLNNVGAGIAHVQSVTPLKNGEPIEDFQAFEDTIMIGRMRGWATLTEEPAAGYLRAGESVTPILFNMGAAESDLSAYLRGQYGPPMDGLDIAVCFCSVFDDCWSVKYADRKTPKPVKSCGITDTPVDYFQTYTEQRNAALAEN